MISTSISNINADKVNNKIYFPFYFLFNYLNNLFPYYYVNKKLVIKDFVCPDFEQYWDELNHQSSPGRACSDLFWIKLPWENIAAELGNINILDTGCGSGGCGERIINWSNNIKRYKGIDVKENENWLILSSKYNFFSFKTFDGLNLLKEIPENTNFFISQSAIEHFDEDMTYFKQLKEYIVKYGKSVIQVHLFPSRACLRNYLCHGVRQYTPRTVSKIVNLFQDFSQFWLYNLGGDNSNKLHRNYITGNFLKTHQDFRQTNSELYANKLFQAIKEDMKKKQTNPTFYALVIHSYINKGVFSQ